MKRHISVPIAAFLVVASSVFSWAIASHRQMSTSDAWAAINLAQGKPGDGGRRVALETLCSRGADLTDVDLSGATLKEIKLSGATLPRVNLSYSDLFKANFENASLGQANLQGAFLVGTVFNGSSLWQTNLSGADLSGAELRGAELVSSDLRLAYCLSADLSGVDFDWADLSGAYLARTHLNGANFSRVNLRASSLMWADLSNIENWETITDMELANVYEVFNAPDGFVDWAINEKGAVSLPHKEWLAARESMSLEIESSLSND